MTEALIFGLESWDVADLVARTALGGFFAISGYHKLFNAERHATMKKTLVEDGVPFVRFNEWFVPAVEFTAGITTALGFLTIFSALLLGAICLVALCVDGWKRVTEMKPIDKADLVDDVLYLPETLYGLLILVIVITGPGAYSVDALLFGGL